MTEPKLTQFKAIIFDVYATLVDWETGIYTALKPILPPSWSRKDALTAFQAVELDLQAQHPDMLYADLLAAAHAELEKRVTGSSLPTNSRSTSDPGPSSSPEDAKNDPHQAFARTLASWPLFPDTLDALQSLSKHFKLVVLSNVDRTSFADTRAQLQDPFSLVVTAQDVGAYKPSTIGYQRVIDLITAPLGEGEEGFKGLGVKDKSEILVVAQSLTHDHVPARVLGLATTWIDRKGAYMGVDAIEESLRCTWRFETLGEMADAVEKEVRA